MGSALSVAENTALQLKSQDKQLKSDDIALKKSENEISVENKIQCPVLHKNYSQDVSVSECPIQNESEKVNPFNMMANEKQKPSPGQPFLLPTERQVSSIPKAIIKGGENPYWEYPSQQMFWNAMLRKGWRWKKDDLKPEDMENIIKIHNINNERAWQEIVKWEKALHGKECDCPKLKSFGGKAKDYTPKAIINWLVGHDLPFDRHDWIIDRCGKDVKYVIDYYTSTKAKDIHQLAILDVRPAIDSFENMWDRMKVAWWRFFYHSD